MCDCGFEYNTYLLVAGLFPTYLNTVNGNTFEAVKYMEHAPTNVSSLFN